ncbi:succinate dehydrogenase, cytochrome b556 subunit [Tistrella bauzanensis]|uniref:Succinate dehydrogenase cytochrome b556 subunit n=1 Tax=Tistrella bauzanensis TaxID=657419 RepID=A0ABQ1IXA6_9PROT|nr:succinate dehydrogenase, cytochrome b556 subunit [Tistrella bauzanensis]GGB54888.1 succinate dehydrogenase, cytochrome b556 subunit [Tistrella bauzanensis]
MAKTDNRPLSPHLQVYRLPMTALMSISHRATGVVLSVGTLLLAWWLIAAATSAGAFETAQGFFGSWFGMLVMFGWTLCLFYHLANGIRHLVWDTGHGFDIKTAEKMGRIVLVATVALTLIAWIIGLAV